MAFKYTISFWYSDVLYTSQVLKAVRNGKKSILKCTDGADFRPLLFSNLIAIARFTKYEDINHFQRVPFFALIACSPLTCMMIVQSLSLCQCRKRHNKKVFEEILEKGPVQ